MTQTAIELRPRLPDRARLERRAKLLAQLGKLVRLPKQRSFAAGLAGSAAELAPRVMRRQPLLLAFLCLRRGLTGCGSGAR